MRGGTKHRTLGVASGASRAPATGETSRTYPRRRHMTPRRRRGVGARVRGAVAVLGVGLWRTRQWLHGVSITFARPADGHEVSFTSAYPPDLAHALDVLRAES